MNIRNLRISSLNIKKRKGAAISLLIFVFLSAMFLSLGLNISKESAKMFDKNIDTLQEPENIYIMAPTVYKPEQMEFLKQDSRVEGKEFTEMIALEGAKIAYSEGTIETINLFFNMDKEKGLMQAHVGEQIEVSPSEAIYVPAAFSGFGYRLGDQLSFNKNGSIYTYTIAGYIDTTNFGIVNVGGFKYYFHEEAYEKLYNQVGASDCICVKCANKAEAGGVDDDFRQFVREKADTSSGFSYLINAEYVNSKSTYNYIAGLIAAILMGFSVVIGIVSILSIRFRILNNMEDNIVQIGVLGALGYTGSEIIKIYSYEYIVTSFIGTLLGVIGAYGITPVLGKVLGEMVGLKWYRESHIGNDLLVIALLMIVVAGSCYLAARRIHKYPPVVALSRGIETHNFRKNYFPLEHVKGNLTFRLALKEIAGSVRQNVVVMICIIGVTFATLFASYLYVTFGTYTDSLKKLVGMEWVDIAITTAPDSNQEQLAAELADLNGVRKVGRDIQFVQMFADGSSVYTTAYDDFDKLETESVYEGRFPYYENEVVITGVLAKKFGKAIGDTINVEYNGYSADYMISGLSQTLSNGGSMIKMSQAGIKKISPWCKLNTINLYLEDGYTAKEIIDEVNRKYGAASDDVAESKALKENLTDGEKIKQVADEKIAKLMQIYHVDSVDYSILVDGEVISGNTRKYQIESVQNFNEMAKANLRNFAIAFGGITVAILIVTFLIIGLMLALIIKALVLKKKVQYGIMKAIGYTTRQLMLQIAVSIMPPVVLGVALGSITNEMFAGKIATLAMGSFGISQVQFYVSPFVPIGVGILLIVYTFITAMIDAGRVRTISVYELLTD